ncbi:MAG: hypothetical protein RLZZ292_1839 [Bacteroidota bacterium]|jgi:hypothetical protein
MKEKLFNLELFSPEFAVFPKMVFKQQFDYHYFLTFNDWFDDAYEYKMLQMFLEAINEPFLYCAVPDFEQCPTLKIDVSKSHAHFKSRYLMEDQPEHSCANIGLRISPTGFWYGESTDWAMVSDLTNNIMIVGLQHDAAMNFRADFGGNFFGIEQVIQNMEEFHHTIMKSRNPDAAFAEMDDKLEILERYKNIKAK